MSLRAGKKDTKMRIRAFPVSVSFPRNKNAAVQSYSITSIGSDALNVYPYLSEFIEPR